MSAAVRPALLTPLRVGDFLGLNKTTAQRIALARGPSAKVGGGEIKWSAPEPSMSLSMHQTLVPPFVRQMKALIAVLAKAEAMAVAKKIDPSILINARLAPDMHPLSRQIQIATDGAKGCAARLSGGEPPSFPDTETTFSELTERLTKTIDYLESIPASDIDGSEERTITLKIGGGEMSFPGAVYLLNFVVPNFYFHATTTYAILRHNGVEIGKRDFLGGL